MDREEFESTVNRRLDMVVRLAFTYLKSFTEAEDTAQEVFFRLFRKNMSFASPEAEKAWLIRVTANYCINRRHTAWFSRRCDTDPESLEITEGECFTEREQTVLGAVMSLPLKYRTAIHLFYYEDYSVKEIAALTGTKESTVRTRLQRGRERLRAILGKEYENECTAL